MTERDLESARLEYEASQNRAAGDAEVLAAADSVIAKSQAARAENHWADMVRDLFRGK